MSSNNSNGFYCLLGIENEGTQLFYQILDTKDGTIDLLNQKELDQVSKMNFNIVRLYGSRQVAGVKHIACKIPESSTGVLFRVQNTKVVAMPFDERGFYRLDSSSPVRCSVEFVLEEATRVRVYLYFWNSEVYLVIKNEFYAESDKKVEQYSLCKLNPASLTYTYIFGTRRGNAEDLEVYGQYISDIEKEMIKNFGYMTHIRSVSELYNYSNKLTRKNRS